MAKIIGKDLPNMPWQEPLADSKQPVWRYDKNPIIDRFATKILTVFLTAQWFRFKMDMQGYSAAIANLSVWIFLLDLVRMVFTGIYPMSQLPFRVRIQRWQNGIFDMTREFVFWRIDTILHGATDIMSILQSG